MAVLASLWADEGFLTHTHSISLALGGRGLPPYEILWTGATLSSANNNRTHVWNLPFGNYSVHIIDSQCGEAEMNFYIQRG